MEMSRNHNDLLSLGDVTCAPLPGASGPGARSIERPQGSQIMNKSMMAIMLAGTISLSACATSSRQQGDMAQGAAIGAVGGAAIGAVVPGVNVIEGAAIGAGIGGLAGAVWADKWRRLSDAMSRTGPIIRARRRL